MIDALFARAPAVLGHRGASAHAAENTLAAFALARDHGADGVELDVRRTADGVLAIHHDAVVEGLGPLVDLDFAQVREAIPSIPTLAEAIEGCSPMAVNVEIKNQPGDPDWDPGEQVAARVARMAAAGQLADRIWISSFNPATIDRVRDCEPEIATGLLVLPRTDLEAAIRKAARSGHRAIHAPRQLLGPDRAKQAVETCRREGLWLVAWTVDDPHEVVRLAEAGVHAIITNDPRTVRRALG